MEGRPELAASVAVELIRLGVRCVIAAGWEVNDEAAAAFGKTFYEQMLAGENLEMRSCESRKAAYRPNDNTWGAFQCYGDPDYRLRRTTTKPPPSDGDADQFVGLSEAVVAAEQIRDDVNVGLERDSELDAQRDRLKGIETEAQRQGWYEKAQVRVALGEARAELDDLPEAIDLYTAAMTSEKATFKLRAVEQLANLSSRNVVRPYRSDPRKVESAKAMW